MADTLPTQRKAIESCKRAKKGAEKRDRVDGGCSVSRGTPADGGTARFLRVAARGLVLVLILTALFSSCSVVFTASATGRVADADVWQEQTDLSGINDVTVYLYVDEQDRDADLQSLQAGTSPPEGNDARYFQRTTTAPEGGTTGVYSFYGLIWKKLRPAFGKSGDRRQIYLLFEHPEYAPHGETAYIVNDVTNQVPATLLTRSRNQTTIRGTATDADTGDPLEGVSVDLYIPESWTYDADGGIPKSVDADGRFTNPVLPESPSRTFVTDADGEFEGEITYPMMPSHDANRGSVRLVFTYSRNGYQPDPAIDSDLANDADLDGDARITEDEVYYLSAIISADTVNVLDDIELPPSRDENTATVGGHVVDANTGDGVGNVTVRAYVPDERETDGTYVYPDDPNATLLTDADGLYSWTFDYPLFPDEETNDGLVQIVLTFERGGYEVDPGFDPDLSQGDIIGAPPETDPETYLQSADIAHDTTAILPDISIKRADFGEVLDGRVTDTATGAGLNGLQVDVFINIDPAAPPATGTDPDLSTYTNRRVFGTDSPTIQDGYFTFDNVDWTDTTYAGRQSSVTCLLRVYDVSGASPVQQGSDRQVSVFSDADNTIQIEVP